MYEKRFGLHRKPFQSVLSDHDFFRSETLCGIIPGVLHALRSDLGVAVLTGPMGVGKSVTLEAIRRLLESDGQVVLIRGGTVKSAADLLYLLHRRLLKCQTAADDTAATRPSDAIRRWEVVERLQRVTEFWGPLVLLLDDAHLVQPEVFAELRALLEEEIAGQKLLRLLISGPLSLEEVLAESAQSDFAQKIRTHVFLQPLKSSEAVRYLEQNIRHAGGDLSKVMDTKAIERIVAASDGVPRCLNLLADESLMISQENDQDRVTRAIVDQALARLQHLPYAWNVSLYESEDDEVDDTATVAVDRECSSVVEVVSQPGSVHSAPGVIEIGEPKSEWSRVEQPQASSVVVDDTNVFEIGAPAPVAAIPVASEPVASARAVPAPESSVVEVVVSEPPDERLSAGHNEAADFDVEAVSTLDLSLQSEFSATEISADEFFSEASDVLPSVDRDADVAVDSAADLPDEFTARDEYSECDLSDAATVVALSGYTRWEPAGAWPAMLPQAAPKVTQAVRPDATPVFDRYTWCELDRPVLPEPMHRHQVVMPHVSPAVWPPVANGVAPFEPIPVRDVHDGYAGILVELGTLIDATSEDDAPGDFSPVQDDTPVVTTSSENNCPQTAIDRIQHLIDSDRKDTAESHAVADLSAEVQKTDALTSDALHGGCDPSDASWVDGQLLAESETADKESSGRDIADDADLRSLPFLRHEDDETAPDEAHDGSSEQFFTLSIDLDEVQSADISADPESGPSNSRGLEQPEDSERVDAGPIDASDSSHEGPVNVDQKISDNDQRVSLDGTGVSGHDTEVGDIVSDAEEDAEQQYIPRLLRQARQRVVARSAYGGQLRQAAGAETVSATSSELSQIAKGEPCLSISVCSEEDEYSGPCDAGDTAIRFRNLFTRLRQLRNRSA